MSQLSETPVVFVSYPREHMMWVDKLEEALQRRQLSQHLWVDRTKISPGDKFPAEIEDAISRSSIAVLFISPRFLNSPFICTSELPTIKARHDGEELKVLVVFVEETELFGEHDWLKDVQWVSDRQLATDPNLIDKLAHTIEVTLAKHEGAKAHAYAPRAISVEPLPHLVDLRMSIAIDRTRLVSVVIGAEPRALFDSLASTEAMLRMATPDGRFGTRKWRLLPAGTPPMLGDCVVSIGHDATAWSLNALTRLKAACIDGHSPGCGGSIVLCIEHDGACDITGLHRTLSDVFKGAAICTWFSANDQGALDQKMSLNSFERSIVDWLRASLDVNRRDAAIREAEEYRRCFASDHKALLALVVPDHRAFAENAKAAACRLAALSGAAAESWRELIAAASANTDVCQILESLEPSQPLIEALVDASPVLRAALGLVSREEFTTHVKPWFGADIERLRRGRPLQL